MKREEEGRRGMKREKEGESLSLRGMAFIFAAALSVSTHSFAVESADDAEEKARHVHEMATSDVIYTQEETKALYYQNLQIIDLLKEIRDLLDARLEKK